MLDVPKLGLDMLNRMARRIAEVSETGEEFDQSITVTDYLRALVDPKSDVKRALTATACDGTDYVKREKDVMRSMMETEQVKGMM